jgi:hypothetical protein
MNGLSDEPFAGTVLAGNQHVCVRRRSAFDQFDHGPHRGRLRVQRGDPVKGEPRRAFELPPAPERPAQLHLRAHDRQQPRVVPGLLHEVAGAAPHRFDGHLHGAPGRQHDDRQRGVLRMQTGEEIEPLLTRCGVARVIQIDERRVEIGLVHGRQDCCRRRDGLHVEPLVLEKQLQGFQNIGLVIGEKDARSSGRHD